MSDEIDNPIDERQRLQAVLAVYKGFMSSVGYGSYKKTFAADIQQIRDDIVRLEPDDRESELESLKLRGDLRTTEALEHFFEDAVATLEDEVRQMLDRENPSDKNK